VGLPRFGRLFALGGPGRLAFFVFLFQSRSQAFFIPAYFFRSGRLSTLGGPDCLMFSDFLFSAVQPALLYSGMFFLVWAVFLRWVGGVALHFRFSSFSRVVSPSLSRHVF
jgi:hypothetical protein